MWKIIALANKNLTLAIPLFMIIGILYSLYVGTLGLKSLIVPLTFLMVYPMMVNLKINKVFEFSNHKVQILTQLINFTIVPFIAYTIGKVFFSDNPYLALGLLLAALLPTSGMTISWTGFAKGDLEAAIKMTVVGLTLGSVATPFYIKFLMGATIEMNLLSVFKQIFIIVFIPMILGYFTQLIILKYKTPKEFKDNIVPKFAGLSTLGVLGIVFVAMALKADTIIQNPKFILFLLVPLFILYLFNFTLSTIAGKLLLARPQAIALVYGTVMRNLSIALAIAINTFSEQGSEIALIIVTAYIIQVQSAAWYVKFTDKIFGSE